MPRSRPTSASITTSSLRNGIAALGLALVARAAAAQGLSATELDLGPLVTLARSDFYGLSLGAARRPTGQGRAALTVSGGTLDGERAFRVELSGQFLVLPEAKQGVSAYAGIGLGYMGARHYRGTGVLLALLGIESAAGRRHGWFIEAGAGGGIRLRAGYRWRRLPPWWT